MDNEIQQMDQDKRSYCKEEEEKRILFEYVCLALVFPFVSFAYHV